MTKKQIETAMEKHPRGRGEKLPLPVPPTTRMETPPRARGKEWNSSRLLRGKVPNETAVYERL